MSQSKLNKNLNQIIPEVNHRNAISGRKRKNKSLYILFILLEILFVSITFFSIYFIRLYMEFPNLSIINMNISEIPRIKHYFFFFVGTLIILLYWFNNHKLLSFDSDMSVGLFDETIKIIKSYTYTIIMVVGVAFFLKITIYSRSVIIIFWLLGILVSTFIRIIKLKTKKILSNKGIFVRNIIIIGAGNAGQLIANYFTNNNIKGNVIGFIDNDNIGSIKGVRVLGTTQDIKKILFKYPVDEIIITIQNDNELVNKIITEYRKYDITIRIIPEISGLLSKSVEIGIEDTVPYITFVRTPMKGSKLIFKRIFDWLITLIGVILLLPLFLIIALAIKIDSKGPVFYKQKRVGRNGKYFYMLKFRSMIVDAEYQQNKLLNLNDVDGPVFKIKDDPRITRVGKFMRRYSIDELPQLLNVLKLDMSLVGPRPPLPKEVEQYNDWEWRRLEVTPGITGLWQTSGRSDLSFDQWVKLDLYYIENWSFSLDIKLLLKTVPVIFKGDGAY